MIKSYEPEVHLFLMTMAFIYMFYYFVASLSFYLSVVHLKRNRDGTNFTQGLLRTTKMDHGHEGLRGGSWYAIWFNKSVIIELEDGSSGEKMLQKSIPKPNLEAAEFVQEHIYKMTRC